jgi:hypothetical protein
MVLQCAFLELLRPVHTTDNLPQPEFDDYFPHPNSVFDVRIGQEIIWDSSTDTHANLLGHLGDLGVIRIN